MKDGGIPAPAGRDALIRAAGGAAVGAVLAVGWWELLFLPLGASHDGRINSRFGLHVRNFLENGLAGSDLLASMEPFAAAPYNHHPPLLNALHAAVGSVFGLGEWQLHIIGYLAGLATVAGLLWLARELGLGAWPSLAALAAAASTPMFWIYARLGLGVSIMAAFLALWHRCERTGGRRGPLLAAAGAAAFSSWMGAALVVLLSGAAVRGGRSRGAALRVGAAGLGAAALALAWAAAAGGAGELAGHAASRLGWTDWGGLAENYRWFYRTLFPWWFRWLIAPMAVAALVDRRTRTASAALLAALGVWTLAAPGAAYFHDYWTYPLLAPVFLGLAALLDRAARLPGGRALLGAAVALILSAAALGFARLPAYIDAYFRAPAQAGALIREVGPAPGQQIAWVAEGVDPLPRWVSYYWDLPAEELTARTRRAAGDGELVLIRLDRLPAWLDAPPEPVARKGRYALVEGAALRRPDLRP